MASLAFLRTDITGEHLCIHLSCNIMLHDACGLTIKTLAEDHKLLSWMLCRALHSKTRCHVPNRQPT